MGKEAEHDLNSTKTQDILPQSKGVVTNLYLVFEHLRRT